MPTYLEFFCGGGMVREGLGGDWQCVFANDFDHKKCATYEKNWGASALVKDDIRNVVVGDIPGQADLAWASFPCQDLSLAGGGAGLRGDRSGTFWPFWSLMRDLNREGRAPTIIALENVCGTLTSHNGRDFSAICEAFNKLGYRVGAVIIDAAHFLPQSRPRLFIIGVKNEIAVPPPLESLAAANPWHTNSLIKAHSKLSESDKKNWIWWSLPQVKKRRKTLKQIIDSDGVYLEWHTKKQTRDILKMMDQTNKNKLRQARGLGREIIGTMYRRTRPNPRGGTIQRVEVRFDGIAGCLRTPAGGSSRQLVIRVDGDKVQTRLLSTREAASLMGLPDTYELPEKYNEAYHLAGDGVAVPIVRYLSKQVFFPILLASNKERKIAA
jgi:DNA (cytosine-5)-methyltransferase 1